MKISELIETVIANGAPVVATALGGPAAGSIVQYIASHFGIKPEKDKNALMQKIGEAIQANPEKLREIEYQHKEAILALMVRMADSLDEKANPWVANVLIVVLVLAVAAMACYIVMS